MKKQHPAIATLLVDIEAYLKITGLDPTNFGLLAVNDGHFIARVKEGRMPRLDTIDRVRRFMNESTKAVRPKA